MEKYFKLRKEEDSYLEFELSNVNISLANAIRRIVLAEVETYAIDQKNITIQENTCPLHNEYISHRISLIPIRQNLGINVSDLEFYLSKKNSKDIAIENEQSVIMEVTTQNVQVFNTRTAGWLDPDSIFDGIYLITKLNLKQKILGKFIISSGIATQHSRWQCVNTIAYRYKTKADLSGTEDYDKISLEEEHTNWIKKGNTEEPVGFIFCMEANGKMEPRLIITRALEILKKKCIDFVEFVKVNRSEIAWHNSSLLEVEYEGEMHTLGNLISTIGLELLGEFDFIGYRIIHPMINKFILRMSLHENENKEEHVDKLVELCRMIINIIDILIKEWSSI